MPHAGIMAAFALDDPEGLLLEPVAEPVPVPVLAAEPGLDAVGVGRPEVDLLDH